MESVSKHGLNSENSSEKSSDQPEKFKEENTGGGGRFYGCNFCKRGFTNAQALGGHMNIHRKDRVKVKQLSGTPKSSFANKSGEEYCMNPRYFEHLSSDHGQYFAVPMGGNIEHQFCVPTSNPNFSPGYRSLSHPSDSATLRTEHFSLLEDHKTANLSIQIDDYSDHHQEDGEGRSCKSWNETEVDLELRLG